MERASEHYHKDAGRLLRQGYRRRGR